MLVKRGCRTVGTAAFLSPFYKKNKNQKKKKKYIGRIDKRMYGYIIRTKQRRKTTF